MAERLARAQASFVENFANNGTAAPPCNLPPAPAPGQRVVWTRAGSPYQICTDLLIPAGGSGSVEPGVTVNVDDGKSLVVDGRVTGHRPTVSDAAPV